MTTDSNVAAEYGVQTAAVKATDLAQLGTHLSNFGKQSIRYTVAGVLAWIGAMKFTAYEAGAIEGLVASSPLTGWLYDVFSVQGAANLIGGVEIATALLIVAGTRIPLAAIAGALGAIATFSITLSFLFTAPGWEPSLGGFPALSVVPGQFLLKDGVLLASAVWLRPGGLAHRLLFRWMTQVDRSALLKWKGLLQAGPYTPDEQSFLRRYRFFRSLWIFNRKRRGASGAEEA